MILFDLLGKLVFAAAVGLTVGIAWEWHKRMRIDHIAWQKRVQADIAAKRDRLNEALADRAICDQLALLPESEDSND